MERHYRRFRENLILGNLSPRTIKSYTETVKRYFRFCRERKVEQDATASVRAYLLHLTEIDRAPSTINIIYSALKRYFVDGQVADWDLEALPRQRRPRRLPVALSREQVLKLFDSTPRWRNRVAFMVAYSGGLRRNEVRQLRVEDIDSKSMRLLVREGKGKKERYVMLSQRLLEHLRTYWRFERPRTWLFPGDKRPDQPVPGDTLGRAFRLSRDRARLPARASFHSLRHSFATHLLESNVPLPKIKALLGHTSLQSTMIYLQVANASQTVTSPLDSLGLSNPALAGDI